MRSNAADAENFIDAGNAGSRLLSEHGYSIRQLAHNAGVVERYLTALDEVFALLSRAIHSGDIAGQLRGARWRAADSRV